MEKAKDRLEVIERIKEYEKNGWWDRDVENDPPAKVLMPNEIDYLNKKLSSKIATSFANKAGTKFYENLIKNNQLIIKKVNGLENLLVIQGGAIITSNHFNVCDNYAIYRAMKPHYPKKFRLWKVIREGNYTNSPPPFGFILRNCNTLPLSSSTETMKKFMRATSELLKRGEKILIYPEQGMWWNYRKPRPTKNGAYRLAVNNDVPVVPVFITMEDSEFMGADGFSIQAYTINFMPAIHPKRELSKKENIEYMQQENYRMCKECYEEFYKIPLTYGEE